MALEIIIAILVAGASYVQAKKAQKKAKEATEGVEANIESNSKEIPVIYGERRVGGVRVYIDTSRDTKHKYLYMVLAMAEGEVESISDIKIDDIPITDSRFKLSGGDQNLWYEAFTGTDTQTVSTLIRNGVSYDNREDVWVDPFRNDHEFDDEIPDITYPWTVNHRLQGIAYLALKFKWDENAYQGIPDVTAVVKGKKVYDPRTQTTAWSDNPALCILDYLTNEKYGKGLTNDEIDLDAFGQAATDCENFTVTPFSGSTAEHQLFTMDAVIDTKNKIIENLNDMLIGCRGFLPFTQGKYRLIIDQPKNSVFTFTQDHIIDGISIKGSRKEDRFNQVKVNFYNKGQEYKEDQAIYPESNSTLYQQYLAEDQGEPLVEELDIYSFDNLYSAREMARLVLERSRKNLGIAFNATSEALVLDIGDVFAITHPTPAWTNKLFQVQELSFNYDGTVSVSAVEYDADLYTYDEPEEEQPFVGSRLPDTSSVDPVTSVTGTAGSYIDKDGKTIGYIDVSWTPPNDEIVDRYDVKVEYDGKEEIYNTAVTEHRIKPTIDDTDYTISVRAINGINVRSAWTTIAAVSSVADTNAPANITGITATGGLQTIDLSWTNPSDDDFDLVRIKVNNSDEEPESHTYEVRSNEFLLEVGSYNATRHFWLAPVDRTGNVGNYVSGGSATTGQPDYDDLLNTPTIPEIPDIAGTFYISLPDSDAPTDTEFNTAVGRDPLENDFVVVSYPDGEETRTKGYNYNGDPLAWTEVTEYIDGSMIVTGSLSASDITTGTLNANDVTISNLTIGGSQLPNNIAYIRDTKNIAVTINEDVSGSNVGEAVLSGYTDGVSDKTKDGLITYKGQSYIINRTQGTTDGVTILTAASNKNGYIVYDSTESNKFTTSGYGNRNVVFAWYDGTNWRYDPNNTTGTIFTPTDTDLALGTMSTGSSDFITSAELFFEVVKLTEAQEKGTTINYGYTEFTTSDEVTGIVTQYTNDQGFISSVSWNDVLSKPTDLVVDSDITDVVRNSDITDVVRDSDITDVVREEQVYSNLLIDSDETQQVIPYPVTEASAIEYTINSSVARSEALIVLDILDAEGVTIANGVQWSLNGVYQSQLNGPDNARIEYKFVVPLISGDNSIKIWSEGQDGGTVYSVKAYTYESGGGQWFRLSGRANTNAPSDEDFKLAFGRYPRPRDVILVESTSGATASYYFNKTTNAWDNAEAIVHGDLIVSESITALGEVTAGTFALGNGAFTVNSSGQLSATGAIIDGNITADSLDVENATVTGTFIAPIGWNENVYSGVINRGNLNESVKDLIDERIAEVTGGISGDFGQDDGSFSHIAQGNPDPDDPIVLNITHETGKNLTVELSGSRSWNREFVGLPETDMGVSITLERSPAGADTWTTLATLTDAGSSITTSRTQLTGTTYAYSISIYHVLTDDQESGNYDYRARTTVAGAAYNVGIPLQLTVVEPATVGAGNADTLDNQDGTYYLDYNNFTNKPDLSAKADLAGGTFTGTVRFNTNSNTTPVKISREASDGQNLSIGVDDTVARFTYTNDESVSGMYFRLINTDTETGGGESANEGNIRFNQGATYTSITVNDNEVYHEGNFTDNSSNWDTAYSWGNHADAGYLTSIGAVAGIQNGVETAAYGEIQYRITSNNDIQQQNRIYAYGSKDVSWDWKFKNLSDETPVTRDLMTLTMVDSETANLNVTGTLSASGYNNSDWDTAYGWGDHSTQGYLTSHQDISGKADLSGDTFTGDILISKTDATLTLKDTNTSMGTYPRINFDTDNNQGVTLYGNEFDSELPFDGYGLVLDASATNAQYPTTGELGFVVKGEIYAGSTTLLDTHKVYHRGDFSDTQISNWDTAYTYSQVGHLPLSGGTVTGTLVVGSNTTRKPIQVKSSTYAEVQFFTDGTEYARIGTAEGGSLGTEAGDFYTYSVNRNKMHLIVPKDGGALKRENGTITIWDSGHFANNSSNWDTAYGWGDHSTENYAVTTGDTFTGDLIVNSNSGTMGGGVNLANFHFRVGSATGLHFDSNEIFTQDGTLHIGSKSATGSTIVFHAEDGVAEGAQPAEKFKITPTYVKSSTKLHVMEDDIGASFGTYSGFLYEGVDAHLDIASNSAGSWGSSINLKEYDEASPYDYVNAWSIARNTGSSPSLNFNFGTLDQHNVGNIKVRFTSTGVIYANGGNSSEWNTGYDYSQIGHLPLSGGTLTGDLNFSAQTDRAIKIDTTVEDDVTRDAIELFEDDGQATGRQAISWWNDNQEYYKARLWTEVGNSYNNTKFGIDVADNNRTLATRLYFDNGNAVFSGNVTAPSFVGRLQGAATGASDATIWCVSGQYTNWGIFYDEATPDLIQFKSAGNTKASIALDNGNINTSGTVTAVDATLSGGDLRIYNDASNYGRILFGEAPLEGNLIIEYDGTGSGATNYFNFYSDVSGWATKGSSLNIQPLTGNVAVGSNTFTEKFNVTGNITADAYKVGTTTVIDSSRNIVNVGNITASGQINLSSDHYLNRSFSMIENAGTQWILLCQNAGNNDVNGTITIDRTSGNYQAVMLDVIVSSGTSTMFGGTIRTLQVLQQSEDYRLVSVTYDGVNYIAIKYTGNTYPLTTARFNGRLKSTAGNQLTTVSSGITNEASFGGSSESYNEVDNFVVSGSILSSGITTTNKLSISNASFDNHFELVRAGSTTQGLSPSGGDLLHIGGNFAPNANGGQGLGRSDKIWSHVYSNSFQIGTTTVIDSGRNAEFATIETTGTNRFSGDYTYFGTTTSNRAEIVINTFNAGSPQITFTDNQGDMTWSIGGDDADNHFKLHGNYSSSIPIINNLSTPQFEWQNSGNFIAQGNITAYSDERLKGNIEIIDNALDKVSSLKGVTFDKIHEEDDIRHTGVIAQDVEKVLPEAVITHGTGYKSVAYGNMVGLLIEAIKELKSEIEELKNGTNSN